MVGGGDSIALLGDDDDTNGDCGALLDGLLVMGMGGVPVVLLDTGRLSRVCVGMELRVGTGVLVCRADDGLFVVVVVGGVVVGGGDMSRTTVVGRRVVGIGVPLSNPSRIVG